MTNAFFVKIRYYDEINGKMCEDYSLVHANSMSEVMDLVRHDYASDLEGISIDYANDGGLFTFSKEIFDQLTKEVI